MNRQRKIIGVRRASHGLKQSSIKTVEDSSTSARFKNRFDTVDALLLQLIHLLPGVFGGSRQTRELFFGICSNVGRKAFEILGAVSSRRREQRAAGE